jgi:ABC-type branched-subunit amino acid transport system substrate-binding protein
MVRSLFVIILAFTMHTGSRGGPADDGVKPTEILIGQCAALSGPAAGLGTGVQLGLKAALDEVNEKGGVGGRKIILKSLDDAYEPEKCVECTGKLIEEEKVFALAGYVGTPTTKVAVPIVQESKVPLIGAFTGAMLLRDPVQRYVFNIRASYDDETESLVQYLTSQGVKKIAVFYQNDSFGQAGLSGVEKALAKRKMSMAGKGSFERNTLAVKTGLVAVMTAEPDAIIMVGPYKPTAEFVRQAHAAGLKSSLATISFVGTENLIADLGADSEGLLISQVVPPPSDPAIRLTREYLAALKKSAPSASPSYVSYEGYVNGRSLIVALEKAGPSLTREKLVEALDGISNLDLGGMKLSFSPQSHQASNAVFLTRVKAGKAEPLAP